MTAKELSGLSQAELIKLVLHLHQENKQLKAQLNQKEKEAQKPVKTPANSSVPPAAARKKKRPKATTGKKRGGKPGHSGKSRARNEPDVVIECRLDSCPDCGADLSEAEHKLVGRSQVTEIPPIKPVVVEAERYGCRCPQCRQFQQADYPAGLEPERVFGARLEALVTWLHQLHHLSYLRLQQVMHLLFGVMISLGALTNLVQRSARRLEAAHETIAADIRASQVVQSDETGARVNGKNQWQWVFVTDNATYHVISANRGSGTIETVMGDAVPLVWVSDLFSAQGKAKSTYRQICLAHQHRDLQYAIDAERSAWGWQVQQLFLRAQRLVKQRQHLPRHLYQRAVTQLESEAEALWNCPLNTPEALRLQRRYRKHRASLFVFLHHPQVPPDNNASERALRNSVIHRKVSGGFRSETGAQAHAIVVSVADTARKRNQDVLAVLQDFIGQPAPTSA